MRHIIKQLKISKRRSVKQSNFCSKSYRQQSPASSWWRDGATHYSNSREMERFIPKACRQQTSYSYNSCCAIKRTVTIDVCCAIVRICVYRWSSPYNNSTLSFSWFYDGTQRNHLTTEGLSLPLELQKNWHWRLAVGWQTPLKQSGEGVLGCPSLSLSGQRQASVA